MSPTDTLIALLHDSNILYDLSDQGMVIHGDLMLSSPGGQDNAPGPIELPDGLTVEGNLLVWTGAVRRLPERLVVQGSLLLNDRQISSLPDGLVVQADLYLTTSGVEKFPPDMKVHGYISPPASLRQASCFMAGRRDAVALTRPASHHEGLRMRALLQKVPDLWQLASHLKPGSRILLQRGLQDEVEIRYEDHH